MVATKAEQPDFDARFDLSDGTRRYRATLLKAESLTQPFVVFHGDVPPADTDLVVIDTLFAPDIAAIGAEPPAGTICFTPGTRIRTAEGARLVEDPKEGDRISTKDNGEQPVLWVGSRRITGARMHAMPHFRPIRLRAELLGQGRPDADLIVSPDHRILLKGGLAKVMFGTDEVLVAAKDLVNDASITVDHSWRSLTYIHLMLPAHEIVWANGTETESFNPASAALQEVDPEQRQRLYDCMQELERDPSAYGGAARRALNRSEAALMRHEMA